MDTSIFKNAKVHCGSRDGVVSDVSFNEGDYYITVFFHEDDHIESKTYLAGFSFEKGLVVFEDSELEQCKSQLLEEIHAYKNELEKSKRDKAIRISKNETINDLIQKVYREESVALDLIDLYGDESFEKSLYSESFKYLERVITGDLIKTPERICIVIALSFIALKYYFEGDLHSYIEEKAKEYLANPNYTKGKIYKAVCNVLDVYRPKMKYYDKNSYIAVPIIMSCVPHSRVYDLFALSYDIYKKKLLFDEEITEKQIFDKVKETLLQLRKKDRNTDASDVIKGTDYRMSSYTQSCIYTGVEFDSLVEIISKCIQLIINHIVLPEDAFVVGEYYQQGYERWTEEFDRDDKEKTGYEQSRANSRPYFSLRNREIYLTIGEVEFDASLNPNEVHVIIYCNGKKVDDRHLNDPDSVERFDYNELISGFIVNRCDIPLKCNPLDNLHYTIEVSGQEIYSSKNKLFRQTVFFDGKGKEIKPGTEYNGGIFVLTRNKNDDEYGEGITLYKECNGYYISTIEVNSTDVFRFDGEPYVFYKIDGSRFLGYCVPWVLFESTLERKNYSIYTTAIILFRASCNIEDISINIDGQKYYYDSPHDDIWFSAKVFSNRYDGNLAYTVKIYNLESGIHSVRVINDNTGKEIKGASFEFLFDPNLRKDYKWSNPDSAEYDFECSFTDQKTIDFKYGVPQIEFQAFAKNLGHGKVIIFPPTICFSHNNVDWYEIDSRLCLCDFDESVNRILLCGPKALKAYYYTPNVEIERKEANLKTDDEYSTRYSLSLEYLRANPTCNKIYFEYGGCSRYLVINHNPFVVEEECNFYLDEENNEYHFSIVYSSVGAVHAVIKDLNTDQVFFSNDIHSKIDITIPEDNIPETTQYLSVSLHAIKSSGLFTSFESKPFYIFKKFDLERYYFSVEEGYPKIEFLDNGIITMQFRLQGAERAYLRIKPGYKEYKKSIYYRTINNNEIIQINTLLWPFDRYDIILLPANMNEESVKWVKPVFTKELYIHSKVLRRKFPVQYFITNKKGKLMLNGYELYFAKADMFDNEFYIVCKLINHKNDTEMNDVYVRLVEVTDSRIVGSIRFLRSNKLLLQKMKNDSVLDKFVIYLSGGQND